MKKETQKAIYELKNDIEETFSTENVDIASVRASLVGNKVIVFIDDALCPTIQDNLSTVFHSNGEISPFSVQRASAFNSDLYPNTISLQDLFYKIKKELYPSVSLAIVNSGNEETHQQQNLKLPTKKVVASLIEEEKTLSVTLGINTENDGHDSASLTATSSTNEKSTESSEAKSPEHQPQTRSNKLSEPKYPTTAKILHILEQTLLEIPDAPIVLAGLMNAYVNAPHLNTITDEDCSIDSIHFSPDGNNYIDFILRENKFEGSPSAEAGYNLNRRHAIFFLKQTLNRQHSRINLIQISNGNWVLRLDLHPGNPTKKTIQHNPDNNQETLQNNKNLVYQLKTYEFLKVDDNLLEKLCLALGLDFKQISQYAPKVIPIQSDLFKLESTISPAHFGTEATECKTLVIQKKSKAQVTRNDLDHLHEIVNAAKNNAPLQGDKKSIDRIAIGDTFKTEKELAILFEALSQWDLPIDYVVNEKTIQALANALDTAIITRKCTALAALLGVSTFEKCREIRASNDGIKVRNAVTILNKHYSNKYLRSDNDLSRQRHYAYEALDDFAHQQTTHPTNQSPVKRHHEGGAAASDPTQRINRK